MRRLIYLINLMRGSNAATTTIVGIYLFLNIFINYYCDYLSSEGVTMIITCIYSSYFIKNYGIILNTIILMQIIFYLSP